VEAANVRQQRLVGEELPAVFGGLEQLEKGRLDLMKSRLMSATDIQIQALTQQLNQLQQSRAQLAQLDTQHSLSKFIDHTVSSLGPCTPPAPFTYQLGVSIKDMEEGRLEPPIPLAPQLSVGVFGVPLSVLLAREMERGEGLIPHILTVCVERLEMGGYEAEGIFRISIPRGELDAMKVTIDREEYGVIRGSTNPHTAAAVMKEWLRGLPAPIISEGLYDEAVQVGREGVVNEDRVMGVYERVGEEEQRVLEVLAEVTERVVSEEDKNRMSVDNMSIVLSQCVMRNMSEDAATLMEYTRYECRFVAALLRALIGRRERRRRVSSIGGACSIVLDF
jgi:hypothetical protein